MYTINSKGTAQQIGKRGELLAQNMLRTLGYNADLQPIGVHHDVKAVKNDCTLKIEVKTSRKGKDNKWNFTLAKNGHADHSSTDYVIFLFVMADESVIPYIVPTSELLSIRKFSVSSCPIKYAGKLAKYRNNFTIIN